MLNAYLTFLDQEAKVHLPLESNQIIWVCKTTRFCTNLRQAFLPIQTTQAEEAHRTTSVSRLFGRIGHTAVKYACKSLIQGIEYRTLMN